MIYFPMMKMTKDKEVSVFQTTLLVCFCSAEYKDALYKNVSMLGHLWDTASAKIRNPIIGTHSVHWYVQNRGLGFLREFTSCCKVLQTDLNAEFVPFSFFGASELLVVSD